MYASGPQRWQGSLLRLLLRSGESHLPTFTPVVSVELRVYTGPHRHLQLPHQPDRVDTHYRFLENPSVKADARGKKKAYKSPKVIAETS